MPGGSETLTPLVWQPVPGAGSARIYPLIRKIDIISSNSNLIATPSVIPCDRSLCTPLCRR